MTHGPNHLGQAATREAFFAAVAAHHNIRHAARVAGVTVNAVNHRRRTDKAFETALRRVLPADPPVRSSRAVTPALKAAFLEALVETGTVQAAATQVGISAAAAYQHRIRDADFASDWWAAIRVVQDRIRDRLHEGALNGFVTAKTDADGRVTTTVTPRPDILLRLTQHIDAQPSRYRIVEMTPTLIAESRAKLERQTAMMTREADEAARAEVRAAHGGFYGTEPVITVDHDPATTLALPWPEQRP